MGSDSLTGRFPARMRPGKSSSFCLFREPLVESNNPKNTSTKPRWYLIGLSLGGLAFYAGSANIIATVVDEVRAGHGAATCMNLIGTPLHCSHMLIAGAVGAVIVAGLLFLAMVDYWRCRKLQREEEEFGA